MVGHTYNIRNDWFIHLLICISIYHKQIKYADTVGIESIFFFNYTFFLISFLAVVLYLPKPSPSSSSSTVTTMNKQNTSSVEIDDREAGSASVTLLEQNHNISTYSNGHGSSSSSSSRHKSIISLLYGSLSEFLKKYGQFFKAKSIRVLCLNVFLYGSIMCIPDTFFYVSLEKDYHSSRTFNGMNDDAYTYIPYLNICRCMYVCIYVYIYLS